MCSAVSSAGLQFAVNAANSVHITSHSFHHDSVCIFSCLQATAELGGVVNRLLGVTRRRSQSRQAERPIICLSQRAWCVISAGSATHVHIGSPDVDELSAYRAGHPRQQNTRSGCRHPKDTTTLWVLLCRTTFYYQHSLGFLHIYDEWHAKKIKAHENRMKWVF